MKKGESETRLKVVVACSAGGHMIQARRFESIYSQYDYCFFTFRCQVAQALAQSHPVVTIPNITRKNPWSWVHGMVLSAYWAFRIRPDVVFTTGAGIVFFFCLFCKLLGSRLVFLESMARVESLTLTGRMLYPAADLFLVQWPHLAQRYRKAEYRGRLF